MKPGWKYTIMMTFIALMVTTYLQGLQITKLQEDRNRLNTLTSNHDRLWSKQTTFNREYYFKNSNPKRADKEWPLERQPQTKK
jgi:hypothetical protein